jgi:hypothetical protein
MPDQGAEDFLHAGNQAKGRGLALRIVVFPDATGT